MKKTESTRIASVLAVFLVAGLIAIALPSAAPAASGDVAQLAAATVYANGVDFRPNVAYHSAKLTISGPTMVFERTLGSRERLSVDLFDPQGQLLPDGTYKWRLALTPTKAEARVLRRAARIGDQAVLDRWQAQGGVFTIKNGRMVNHDLAEGRPARREGANLSSALPVDLAAPAAAARIGDDTDDAVASGSGPATQRAAASTVAGQGPRSDAATLAAGPAPARLAVTEEQPTSRRSSPTDGKNGRN